MPHLNYNGLDEIWLLKEAGDIHWEFLYKIIDFWEEGNVRCYASFFNISLEFDSNQSMFEENDILTFDSKIFKFNKKIYRSVHTFSNQNGISGKIQLDSIFVFKDKNNNLFKTEPQVIVDVESIEHIDLENYRKIKKSKIPINGNRLEYSPLNLFNGVKLLYFANYLYLNGLSEYKEFKNLSLPIKKLEIYYFSNTAPAEEIFGSSSKIDNFTETLLYTKEKLISYCKIERLS